MTAKVTFGSSPDYLLASVGARSDDYYLQAIEQDGEPPGVWVGNGAADLGLSGEVDPEVFREMYTHLIHPDSIEQVQNVTAERWKAHRKANPELKAGTDEYRAAKGAIKAEVLKEYRLGESARDFSQSTESKVRKAIEKLGEHATPEQQRAAEMGVRRNPTKNVTYADVTFSAPKSWSVFHASLQVEAAQELAAGNPERAAELTAQAEQVWLALKDGAAAGLDHMQEHAGYARSGRFAGSKGEKTTGKRVDAHEWTAAAFAQHTSRDEGPQLHIHTAVFNRVKYTVMDPVTGEEITKWGALDGTLLLREAKAAGHLFERVAEESLTRRLGVRFEMRPDGVVREIVGISQELRDFHSTRRHTVVAGVKVLAEAYEAKHGVRPSAHTLAKMSEEVVLASRKQKSHDGMTREELLERWESTTKAAIKTSLADIPKIVAETSAERGIEAEAFDPAQVIRESIEATQKRRSAWTRADLQVEIVKHLPDCLGGLESDQLTGLVRELTEIALHRPTDSELVALAGPELIPMPRSLQMADGTPIYQVPGGEQYATKGHIEAERRLLDDAVQVGGFALSEEQIERALEGRSLLPGQEAAFRGILGGGRQADVLIGPAGSGKSYLSAAIHDAWRDTGRSVIGLTTSERAARVLSGEGVEHVSNLAMFINSNKALASGTSTPALEKLRLRPGQLVMLDEAGMTETTEMDEVRRLVREAGAKLIYAGDYAQLTSVGAGGMLREMAQHAGVEVFELDEVRRFNHHWEREASLELREGNTDVLDAYETHGRLQGGDVEEMLTAAYQDWLADTLNGHNSLLIATSQKQADQLAAMARADLVRLHRVEADGIHLSQRGITFGVGDQVQLREIDRKVKSHSGDRFAVNRDVVTVVDANQATGTLTVRYDDGELMRLPSNYVSEHVDLAYAGTVHASQGRTVDRCRSLAEAGDTRESLYVALTRGKDGNWAYVVTRQTVSELDGPDQPVVEKMAVLSQVLENSGAELAATAVLRQNLQDSVSLVRWSFVLDDLADQHAQQRFGQLIHDTLGPERYREIRDDEAYGPLVRLARAAEAAGHDPEVLLQKAMLGDLSDARNVTRVLHDRLEKQFDAADRAQVRTDERDVREHVQAQEQAVPEVLGAAQLAEVVPQAEEVRPELVMVYDETVGGWVRHEPETDTAPEFAEEATEAEVPQWTGQWNEETDEWDLHQVNGPEQVEVPAPVMTWDYDAQAWVQHQDQADVEPEVWVLAPPAPRGADQDSLDRLQQQPAYGQQHTGPSVYDAAEGEWVEVEVPTAPWQAVEAQWLDQLTELNTGLEVLHSGQEDQRRMELADEHRAAAEERGRWQSRVAEIPGERGETARAVAELMDGRRLLLGQELADAKELPQWAQSLGEAPDVWQTEQRQEWIERAGSVAAYREAHGWKSEVSAIGPRPKRGAVDFQLDWDRAFRALGEPEERRELVGATDAELREMVDRYEREEAWAPLHVADQLQSTHETIQQLERESAQRRITMLEAPEDQRALLDVEGQDAVREAAVLRSRLSALEEIHQVRGDWHEHTEETRERAQEARRQLELRHQDVEPAEPEVEEHHQGEELTADGQFPEAAWEMAEPEAELPEAEPEFAAGAAEVEHEDVHQDVEPAEPEYQEPAPQQSETMRRYHEELLLGGPAAEQEHRPAERQAPAVEPPVVAEVEPLAGDSLLGALSHAQSARGIMDDRAAYQDQKLIEAQAAIEAVTASRAAAEAVREAAPAVPAAQAVEVPVVQVPQVEVPQIQIQIQ
ncbi:MobF family relaxase [Kitasatospora sp. NPDC101801]|uniref:MobF family relaxase n=1 Tax=Kitasatospora sp. NPDC101801 TaxID=3364103 RepID=UPI003805253B